MRGNGQFGTGYSDLAQFTNAGIPFTNYVVGAAHDLGAGAQLFSIFARDYLWTTPRELTAASPRILSEMLEQGNVLLNVAPGNLGIFAQHSPFVIPAGRKLYVQTVLNVQGNAELVIEGNVVVLPGGRINNQGGLGGTITIADGGRLVNNGHVENVTNSTVTNNGTIVNNDRFEIRANTTFVNNGVVIGDRNLNIHRLAVVS
jgi:hypothetical protein